MPGSTNDRQAQREQLLLLEPLPRVIMKMAVPSIAGFLITAIYNLADTFFVSGLGESATAAVSVNASLDQIIMMAGSMLAVGAASYVSRLLGARSREKADRVLSTSRQGTCFLPIVYPMSWLWGANGVAAVQAVADALSLILAIPLIRSVLRQIQTAGRCGEGGV